MEHQNRRSSSLPLTTPFHDFSLRVNALSDSDVAANFRGWSEGYEIERALRQLHHAVRRIEEHYGKNGPLLSWNAPFRCFGYRRSQYSRPDSPYTPPRTPTTCMDDLRHRLDRANAEIDSLSDEVATTRAELNTAKTLQQGMRAALSARNTAIADLRETIAKQHQRMSRQRDTLYSSRSATPIGEQRQTKPSNRRNRHDSSPNRGAPSASQRNSPHTSVQFDLDVANLRSLLKRQKYDEVETLARAILRRAEETLNPLIKREVGWTLALACERQHKYAEAHSFLISLPQQDQTGQQPSNGTVLALLAHIELKLRDFSSAEKHAKPLWEKYGLNHEEKWHGFHPADILIEALALQGHGLDGKHRFWEAQTIWRAVYEDVEQTTGQASSGTPWQQKMKRHAEAGLMLARQWKESCERRGKVPRTAEMVKMQAEVLRRLAFR